MTDECKHGSLRRSCEICERDEEIERLREEVERLRELLQEAVDVVSGHVEDGYELDSFTVQPWKRALDGEEKYPCVDCGVLRTKAEGGTTFTVCDECWDKRRALDGEE